MVYPYPGSIRLTYGLSCIQVSSLNAPAFLHAYLMGFHQDTGVERNLAVCNEIRAAPVSIEAIGGITSDDPVFDVIGEASEEDFELKVHQLITNFNGSL
ncbi:hypothetical protein Btru_069380 [Bulinus truncatus]|nr:hypothetical protein Btru_069380 [Bulinus truncatus]